MEFSNEENVTRVLSEESLPLFNGKRLTVKERTVNKAAFQFKVPKPRKRKLDDSQQNPERHCKNKEMAPFLSEDLILKLKSSLTVGGSCRILCIAIQHIVAIILNKAVIRNLFSGSPCQ